MRVQDVGVDGSGPRADVETAVIGGRTMRTVTGAVMALVEMGLDKTGRAMGPVRDLGEMVLDAPGRMEVATGTTGLVLGETVLGALVTTDMDEVVAAAPPPVQEVIGGTIGGMATGPVIAEEETTDANPIDGAADSPWMIEGTIGEGGEDDEAAVVGVEGNP